MSKVVKKPYSGKATKVTNDDKKLAKVQIEKAFHIAGLITDGRISCPNCGNNKKGKIKVKSSANSGDPYWHCFPCDAHGDAIELLTKYMNISFIDAVNILLDRDVIEGLNTVTPDYKINIEPAFQAIVDFEVYNNLIMKGSQKLAYEYYSQWHISPQAVKEAGSVVIEDAKVAQNFLLNKFGRERLLKSGILTVDKNGADFFLFSEDYNVIEPHLSPEGDVVGMQFRPSPKQSKKVQAHKKWKKRWSNQFLPNGELLEPSEAWELAYKKNKDLAGERIPYVTPFLSLKGATDKSLVGCGLWRISKLQNKSKIYIVEGFKDLLAARTLGVEAYAIPGVGVMPPKLALDQLKNHQIIVMLDGDKAGERGRESLMSYFKDHKINALISPNIREGMDVADILVERHAHGGCKCITCKSWLKDNPFNKENCPCKACKNI